MTSAAPTPVGQASAVPRLSLVGVSARERAAPRRFGLFRRQAPLSPGALADVHLRADAGVLAILGAVDDGARLLVDLLGGRQRPDRGKLLVAGVEPSRSAGVRRSIGLLAPTAELFPERSVLTSVAATLSLRSDGDVRAEAKALLERFGLRALGERDPRSLSGGEARGVELALALSTPRPAMLVLYEPFVDVGGVPESAIREAIASAGATAPVVIVTASPTDAQVASTVYALHKGALARHASTTEGLGSFERTELHVWVASKGRELARALAASPALRGVAWEAAADPASDGGVLRIAGPDVGEVALALADAAIETGASIVGYRSVSPTLGEVRATTEAIRYAQYAAAHAAYRDAYAAHARQAEEARARAAQPARPADMFGAPSRALPAAQPAWVPASTPPPAPAEPESAEAIAAQEAKWGPKATSASPSGEGERQGEPPREPPKEGAS